MDNGGVRVAVKASLGVVACQVAAARVAIFKSQISGVAGNLASKRATPL